MLVVPSHSVKQKHYSLQYFQIYTRFEEPQKINKRVIWTLNKEVEISY